MLMHEIEYALEDLVDHIYNQNKVIGWWNDIVTGEAIVDRPHCIGEKLMLIVSEISEAMEGHKRNRQDAHLPHRSMLEVELADALIRICDLAGALGLDLAGAVVEKLKYNAERQDHKRENRLKDDGKKF